MQKIACLLALTWLLLPTISHAADMTALSRARYAAVDKAVTKLTPIKRELRGYRVDGGELTAYFHKGVPRKLIAKNEEEMGTITHETYFWKGQLFFGLRTYEPYAWNVMQGRTQLNSRRQSRFYFTDGKLTRYVNDDGIVTKNRGQADATQQQNAILAFAREMLRAARGESKVFNAPRYRY